MRMLIAVMVYAENSKGAVKAAHDVVNKNLRTKSQGGPFDWFVDFGKDEPLGLIHKGLWGPIPSVLQVSTARFPTNDMRGLEMVKSAMEKNREAFKKDMANIRHQIERYTDDELFDGFDLIPGFRTCIANVCGDLKGLRAHLYDPSGRTISNPFLLQMLLDENYYTVAIWEDPDFKHFWEQTLWVVPFDAYY
jgi:hypothetical protein